MSPKTGHHRIGAMFSVSVMQCSPLLFPRAKIPMLQMVIANDVPWEGRLLVP